MPAVVPFEDVPRADLIVDAVYEGGLSGNASDEVISKLVGSGVSGGIRKRKRRDTGFAMVALVTTESEPDWPDRLDPATGILA